MIRFSKILNIEMLHLAMAKIIAIDYGAKRCGIAETDDLQIIASALETVEAKSLMGYLVQYLSNNRVEAIVVGLPLRMSGEVSDIEDEIQKFIQKFSKTYPKIKVERMNEAFTSKLAMDAMIQSGVKKKDRRVKGNLDKISATIILQQYMEMNRPSF